MIGIIIPGQLIITGGPITSNMVVSDVKNPLQVNNISLFQMEALPDGYVASLYYSFFPYTSLEFLGCVCNQRPSDIFYTGWNLNNKINLDPQLKICVKFEKLTDVQMAYEQKIKFDINPEFAKRVAKNLYNYLDSFNQNQDNQLLFVPINSLEKWYDKFLQKYKIDPNFLMKTDI